MYVVNEAPNMALSMVSTKQTQKQHSRLHVCSWITDAHEPIDHESNLCCDKGVDLCITGAIYNKYTWEWSIFIYLFI